MITGHHRGRPRAATSPAPETTLAPWCRWKCCRHALASLQHSYVTQNPEISKEIARTPPELVHNQVWLQVSSSIQLLDTDQAASLGSIALSTGG